MTALSIDGPAEQVEVVLSIRNEEFLRQVREFLERSGYACQVAGSAQKPNATGVVVAEVELHEAAAMARAAQPDARMLFICAEPADIGRILLPEARMAFLEKPFAWRELENALLALLRPCPDAAVA